MRFFSFVFLAVLALSSCGKSPELSVFRPQGAPADTIGALLQLNPSDVAAEAGLRSVRLRIYTKEGRMGGGSGTTIKASPDGAIWILTARHVVKDAVVVQAEFFRHTEPGVALTIAAKEWVVNEREDAALVKVEEVPSEFAVATPLAERAPSPGERVLLAGYPHLTKCALTDGRVTGIDYIPMFGTVWRHSAHCVGGHSGGPVLSERGELLGVHVGSYRGFEHGGLMVPVSELLVWISSSMR